MSRPTPTHSRPSAFTWRWLAPQYWLTWLLLASMWCMAQLPFRWQRRSGRWLGRLLYHVSPTRRRITRRNLKLAFPEYSAQAREALVRDVFAETARSLPETCVAWFSNPARTGATWEVENLELAQDAVRSGRGALFVGAHFSCVDICGAFMGSLMDFDSLHRPHNNPLLNHFQHRGRLRFLGGLIARKDMRQMLRRLRQGRGIFYAPDQDLGRRHSLFVPFFGVATATVTATSKLAAISGCDAFLVLTVRTETGYRIRIEAAPQLAQDDTRAALTAYNQWLENEIRQRPAQYLWLHKRFKTRPDNEPDIYGH